MNETFIMILLASGGVLWCLGGSGIPPFKKGWRRFVWPIAAAAILVASGMSIAIASLVGISLAAVNILPYGEHTPWLLRITVLFLLPAPALLLSLNAWWLVLLGGALITGMAWLTRHVEEFTHKILEFFCGATQASAIVIAALYAR